MKPFQNKKVLVIGGTGSLGGALVKRLITGKDGFPARISILSRDEEKQHNQRVGYRRAYGQMLKSRELDVDRWLRFILGDVREIGDLVRALDEQDIVINAAALKQVPNCEYFPDQALLTNCVGTRNLVRAIRDYGCAVQTVVGIGTDKACEPINVMGITKALQERILIAANLEIPRCRFVGVRYGNVMGSRGSVIPLFLDQIKHGGPVTVTDGCMSRFLLTLDDAVDAIVVAIQYARCGEITVPTAPAATVATIAEALIDGRQIAIDEIGVRPGERPHEMMISPEEAKRAVRRGDYYFIKPMLPELRSAWTDDEQVIEGALYSSDCLLTMEATRSLLSGNGFIEAPAHPAVRVVAS